MRKNTLYVTDMDGTLLDNNSRVSCESAELIAEMSEEGALITVATARTPATVDPLLSVTHINCPAIVITGAAMWDTRLKVMNHVEKMTATTAGEIIDRFRDNGVDPFVYVVVNPSHLEVYHGTEMNHAEESFYLERKSLKLKRFLLGHAMTQEAGENVILIFGIGDSGKVIKLADDLKANVDCSVSCYPDIHFPGTHLIEVFKTGVSKAQAVERLAQELGVERIVVFGDNLNDLPMMKVADVAVAVENAFPEVKEAADIVIGSNAAHSVARFIRED
ncbi:MAG: Cof-type HAD-IIB family hydrolase [Bacteroidales bacterium]|nr:Cof-type HAD-IIB family hydrolase [Bacteroidales bacterium]